jgi:16S rRNA (adenine1518-N6/adenine1519-N6)-dimethyltransferase
MPLTPSATQALLAQLGHRPRHALGQNFLIDGNIVRKSLALADVQPGEPVVEIGPGLGTLTSALLEGGAEVWAVERDRTLHRHLEDTLGAQFPRRLHLLEGHAVEHPLAGLPPGSEFKIVSNLPYAIATPWLDAVLAGPLPMTMVLMLQREAARRYAAQPGGKEFGAISIFLQGAYEIFSLHPVAAVCFHPRPDVESCLLELRRRPAPALFSPGARRLIRSLFQRRRKQIGSLLRELWPGGGGTSWLELLRRDGFSPQTRPEALPVSWWVRLASAFESPA